MAASTADSFLITICMGKVNLQAKINPSMSDSSFKGKSRGKEFCSILIMAAMKVNFMMENHRDRGNFTMPMVPVIKVNS